ncbi:alpha/beta hydrolase [Granulicella cerasi]|uniref:Alpha/beta hydrolase n=1 Tax=Granulicella cerasi TaxID=741063 RepID=A0ABW1Z7Z8_9BACT
MIIRAKHSQSALPITFYFHGGGWVLGSLQTHTMLLCQLALRSGRAIAFVDYPRAPETGYPHIVNHCVAAVTETLANADALNLSTKAFQFGGDSSGGNLAIATLLELKRQKLAAPDALLLLYPVTDHTTDSASYLAFAQNPNLSAETMDWFWAKYLPDAERRAEPLASPLTAPVDVLSGFPRTLIVNCEYDVLRDQGEALAAKLIEAGVEVTAIRWLGALHGFLVTEELLQTPSAQLCVSLLAQYCRGAEPYRSA